VPPPLFGPLLNESCDVGVHEIPDEGEEQNRTGGTETERESPAERTTGDALDDLKCDLSSIERRYRHDIHNAERERQQRDEPCIV